MRGVDIGSEGVDGYSDRRECHISHLAGSRIQTKQSGRSLYGRNETKVSGDHMRANRARHIPSKDADLLDIRSVCFNPRLSI